MRFQVGQRVQVFSPKLNLWNDGKVVRVWAVGNTENFDVKFQYDVDGEDQDGPFHGTWDDENVRLAIPIYLTGIGDMRSTIQ